MEKAKRTKEDRDDDNEEEDDQPQQKQNEKKTKKGKQKQINFNSLYRNDESSIQEDDNQNQSKKAPGPSVLSIEYYQPYFDIETIEVGHRIYQAILPYKTNFFEIAKKNPDLYGPFWIYTTLIFTLAAIGNVGREKYDFSFVPSAASLVYGFGFIVPIILAFLMNFFGSQLGYLQVICIYGYAIACYIPVTLLCIIQYDKARIIFLCYGLINSSWFLIRNFQAEFNKYIDKRRYVIVGFILGCQALMFLIYKFNFLSIYDAPKTIIKTVQTGQPTTTGTGTTGKGGKMMLF